jgi:uncharacterized protein (DUF305 family)
MKKEGLILGVAGLLVGGMIGGSVVALMPDRSVKSDRTAMSHSEMSMSDMNEELRHRSGDDFDKAFIEMMVAHHEGAIEMAELIPGRAKHDEIKKLGEEIIKAQAQEIRDMKQWQADWGYRENEMMQDMHGH